MELPDEVLGATVGAAVTGAGWALNWWTRRGEKQDRYKRQIREVFQACDTRAVYTRTHAQLDIASMFQAITACKYALQKLRALVEDHRAQLVADIIGHLGNIERQENAPDPEGIDTEKRKIIGVLQEMGAVTGVPYVLPRTLVEGTFWSLADAIKPLEKGG